MMYYYGHGDGFGPLEFLGHILWFVIIVALIIFALRLIRGRGPRRWSPMMRNPSLDILAERYARGEISKEEYEERKKVLSE